MSASPEHPLEPILETTAYSLPTTGPQPEYHIPLDIIRQEPDVYLDAERQANMAASMVANGQLDPIKLARVDGNGRQLLVVDGFYRLSALHEQQRDSVNATVRDMTIEEVVDARIADTMWHTPAELGRVMQGVRTAWACTEWADVVPVAAAATLADTLSSGQKLGMQIDQVLDIRRWFSEKEQAWGLKLATINRTLRAIEGVAPDIVESAKIVKGRMAGVLTAAHLSQIRKQVPAGDYDQQRQVAQLLQRYPVPVSMLPHFFKRLRDAEGTPEEVAAVVWQEAQRRQEEGNRRGVVSRQERATAARSNRPTATRAVLEAARRVDGEDNPTEAHQEPLQATHTFGAVKFDMAEYWFLRKREGVIRIYNLEEINRLSEINARQFGVELNELEVTVGGRTILNGDEVIAPESIQMEALNTLLVSYMCEPMPSIKDLYDTYGFARECWGDELGVRIHKLHKILTHWRFQGLVAYDPTTARGAGLMPILIRDRRVFH